MQVNHIRGRGGVALPEKSRKGKKRGVTLQKSKSPTKVWGKSIRRFSGLVYKGKGKTCPWGRGGKRKNGR